MHFMFESLFTVLDFIDMLLLLKYYKFLYFLQLLTTFSQIYLI